MSHKKIGLPFSAPNKIRPSDVLAIPLGCGWFGYARALNGVFFEVLDFVSEGLSTFAVVRSHDRRFYIQYYEPYSVSPWIYLGKKPFESPDSAWGPPTWFGTERFHIIDRGQTRHVEQRETVGVVKSQLRHPDAIVDSIVETFGLDIPLTMRERLPSKDTSQPS